MTILAPLTQLSGSSVTSSTARTSNAMRGAAESSRVASGDIRITSGGVTYISLSGAAESSSEASGVVHTMRWLSGEAESSTTARKGEGFKQLFAPMLGSAGDKAVASIVASFQPMTAYAREAEPVPSYAAVMGEFFPMISSGRMLTGRLAQVSASFMPMEAKLSQGDYAQISGVFAPMQSKAVEGPPRDQLGWYEFCRISTSVITSMNQTTAYTEQLNLAELYSAESIVVEYVNELLSIAGTMTDAGVYSALINEALRVLSTVSKQDEYSAWALNITNNASTSYTGFEFNSMAEWQNKYLAANTDGLYILQGATDDGVNINAALTLGTTDYGTPNKKTITYVYVGAESAGDVLLTVVPDDGELYTYTVPESTTLGTRRAKVGKGIRSRYWQLTLTNTDGADVTIDTVDVDVAELTRRV